MSHQEGASRTAWRPGVLLFAMRALDLACRRIPGSLPECRAQAHNDNATGPKNVVLAGGLP